MEVHMLIVDTPNGPVVLDWRGLKLLFGKKTLLSPKNPLARGRCYLYCPNTLNVSRAFFRRGYHKMDPEKLHRRLYGFFANQLAKTENGTTEPKEKDNTHKEDDNGGTGRG
jgi:hypothetical protein